MNLKKILAGVLVCCVISGNLPAGVRNADNAVITVSASGEYTEGTYESLNYKNYGDYIEITGCDKSATSVVIPAEIDGLPVTGIGALAFFECKSLTEITIPDSVTSIGRNAFSLCTELKTITILNPECEIDDDESAIVNSFDMDSGKYVYSGVIKGYSGSTAEAYAKKYNKTFEAIIEPEFMLGDVTQDGIINGSDATLALRAYTLTSSSLDDELDDIQFKAADADGDGQLTGSDATLILRYYTLLSSITDGSTLPPIEEWIKNS